MQNTEFTLNTPRGSFKIHTIFSSKTEANENGWGAWFEHDGWYIFNKDNHCGAVIRSEDKFK